MPNHGIRNKDLQLKFQSKKSLFISKERTPCHPFRSFPSVREDSANFFFYRRELTIEHGIKYSIQFVSNKFFQETRDTSDQKLWPLFTITRVSQHVRYVLLRVYFESWPYLHYESLSFSLASHFSGENGRKLVSKHQRRSNSVYSLPRELISKSCSFLQTFLFRYPTSFLFGYSSSKT